MTYDESDGRRGRYRCSHGHGHVCGPKEAIRRVRRGLRRRTRLTRDTDAGILAGVCAGIAHRLGLRAKVVRIAAIVSLVLFTAPTVIAYLLIAWLAPRRDEDAVRSTDARFDRTESGAEAADAEADRGSAEGLARLKTRFHRLEEKFADIEAQMLNDRPA